MHEKLFSIQIFQYFRQIPPRVCTLVLFIIIGGVLFTHARWDKLALYFVFPRRGSQFWSGRLSRTCPLRARGMAAADDKFTYIKDLRPGMKNVTCLFVVIDRG